MRRRVLCSTALVAMLVVVLAAPAGAANTPKQWRTKADAVCKASEGELLTVASQEGLLDTSQPTIEQLKSYAVGAAPIYGRVYDDIEAIPVPGELKVKVKKWLSTSRKAIVGVQSAATVAEYYGKFARATKQATALGLKDCAG